MKKIDNILKEYTKKISDDVLLDLSNRLTQNLCGDLAYASNIMSQDKAMDYLLSTATSVDEWYNLIDMTIDAVRREVLKRGLEK